jgi:two-component system, sensor histidine kinase and response regulator
MLLIIDDREDQRMILRSVANHLGVGFHIVGSWEEAEAAMNTVSFDLVLMDWQMPGIDGIEATKRLRAYDVGKDRYTPIIAVTARAMAGDRERCLEAGMDDYLAKPFTLNELRSKLETWLSHAPNFEPALESSI